MEIVWARAYHIDNEKGAAERIELVDGLTDYIEFYMNALGDSRRTALYKLRDDENVVASNVFELLIGAMSGSELNEVGDKCVERINGHFLKREMHAQERISQLGTRIRSGCLVHAIVEGETEHSYLIAKLPWDDFLEKGHLAKTSGILFSRNMLGRSCLFSCGVEDGPRSHLNVSLDSAKVTYFVDEFLEADPIFSHEQSTENCVKYVVSLIENTFKTKQPRVHLELKNTFIHQIRSNDLVNYDLIVNNVFERYFDAQDCPVEPDDAARFMEKLNSLPETKGFSRQFSLVPSKIKKRIISTEYDLGSDVFLTYRGDSAGEGVANDQIFEKVISGHERNGDGYIKVYTNNERAIETFRVQD